MSISPDPSPQADSPGVIVFPPLLYLVALAAGGLAHWLSPRPIVAPLAGHWVGGVLLALGVALGWWARRTMKAAGTNIDPRRPSTALVRTGPFRFGRNPLYVAVTAIYLGLAFLINGVCVLLTLVPVLVVMHYGVVRREERYLESKFGAAYREYRASVRRWL
ncbi:MAG: isoprenylcysteine carboxylmethyltransferase family protein [Acidobacteria bacterium]|nr:MAG: isoprenylcysteine carboxylmethyltransferase family protein [Acidobacteriota bacterium]